MAGCFQEEYLENNPLQTVTRVTAASTAVFLRGQGVPCPTGTRSLDVVMDCEDSKSRAHTSGWVGDSYVDGNGNMVFKFCIAHLSEFSPVSNGDEAIISGAISNRKAVTRLFDCEDSNTRNSFFLDGIQISRATLNYNNWGIIEDGNCNLSFTFQFAGKRPSYYNQSYGVFGGSHGYIHTDDEDSGNRNSYTVHNWRIPENPEAYVRKIFSEYGKNTTIKVTKVK